MSSETPKKSGWGGARPGTGRKRGVTTTPPDAVTQSRSVTLRAAEWQALADAAPDGSPNKEAARRLRASLSAHDTNSGTLQS